MDRSSASYVCRTYVDGRSLGFLGIGSHMGRVQNSTSANASLEARVMGRTTIHTWLDDQCRESPSPLSQRKG